MEINLKQLIAQILNFLILVFLLRKFLWKNILGVLEARREKIAAEFKDIETTKAELAKLKIDYETKLANIEETARAKMQEVVSSGQKIAQEIQDKARADSQRILAAAQEEIRIEILKAKEELKQSVVDLTLRATENMIQEKLTPESDKRLVENFLKELDAKHGQ